MKILYHHRIGSTDGGEVVHIRELIASLRALGHEVIVSGPVDLENSKTSRPLKSALRIRDALPGTLSDLFEFSLSLPTFFDLLARYLKHRPDIVYERANLFSVATAALKRLTGCKLLVEVNAPLTFERANYNHLSLRALAKWSEEVVWRSADYVLPVTVALGDIVKAAGIPNERIVVIPNGVRAEDFDLYPQAKRELGFENQIILGFVGYPRDWNRLEYIVELLVDDEFTNTRFVIVGEGPAISGIRELSETLQVDQRVTFTGPVPRDRVPYYVSSFDIAVQPGVTSYASPLKVVEYMAMERAIVAPGLANIRELLSDGETALLFTPDDVRSLRSCLLKLLRDPRLREKLGKAARQKIRGGDFTWAANAKRITQLASELRQD